MLFGVSGFLIALFILMNLLLFVAFLVGLVFAENDEPQKLKLEHYCAAAITSLLLTSFISFGEVNTDDYRKYNALYADTSSQVVRDDLKLAMSDNKITRLEEFGIVVVNYIESYKDRSKEEALNEMRVKNEFQHELNKH